MGRCSASLHAYKVEEYELLIPGLSSYSAPDRILAPGRRRAARVRTSAKVSGLPASGQTGESGNPKMVRAQKKVILVEVHSAVCSGNGEKKLSDDSKQVVESD